MVWCLVMNQAEAVSCELCVSSLFLPLLILLAPCCCWSAFFCALMRARLARGRISRTCLGGITYGWSGLSPNGCSLSGNILSLRSLSWKWNGISDYIPWSMSWLVIIKIKLLSTQTDIAKFISWEHAKDSFADDFCRILGHLVL